MAERLEARAPVGNIAISLMPKAFLALVDGFRDGRQLRVGVLDRLAVIGDCALPR
jgi:hypothetical protein